MGSGDDSGVTSIDPGAVIVDSDGAVDAQNTAPQVGQPDATTALDSSADQSGAAGFGDPPDTQTTPPIDVGQPDANEVVDNQPHISVSLSDADNGVLAGTVDHPPAFDIPAGAPSWNDIQLLRNSGGYTPAQINAFIDRQRPKWYQQGSNDAQIDNYYAVTPYSARDLAVNLWDALDDALNSGSERLAAFAAPAIDTAEDSVANAAVDAADAVNAGTKALDYQFEGGPSWHDVIQANWQQSMLSKTMRMSSGDMTPELQLPPDGQTPFLKSMVGSAVKFAGDAPADVETGAAVAAPLLLLGASAPLTLAVAGGVALAAPDLFRKYVNQSYLAGRAENFSDFLQLAKNGFDDFLGHSEENIAANAFFELGGPVLNVMGRFGSPLKALEQSRVGQFVANRIRNAAKGGFASFLTNLTFPQDGQPPDMKSVLENAVISMFMPASEKTEAAGKPSAAAEGSPAHPAPQPLAGEAPQPATVTPSPEATESGAALQQGAGVQKPPPQTPRRQAEMAHSPEPTAAPPSKPPGFPEVDSTAALSHADVAPADNGGPAKAGTAPKAALESLSPSARLAAIPKATMNLMDLNERYGIPPEQVSALAVKDAGFQRRLAGDLMPEPEVERYFPQEVANAKLGRAEGDVGEADETEAETGAQPDVKKVDREDHPGGQAQQAAFNGSEKVPAHDDAMDPPKSGEDTSGDRQEESNATSRQKVTASISEIEETKAAAPDGEPFSPKGEAPAKVSSIEQALDADAYEGKENPPENPAEDTGRPRPTKGTADRDASGKRIRRSGERKNAARRGKLSARNTGNAPPKRGRHIRRPSAGPNREWHHAWPLYLGGLDEQKVIRLNKKLHKLYHSRIQRFAPQGNGEEYYRNLPLEEKREIFGNIFDATKKFDADFGTSLYDRMIEEMEKHQFIQRGFTW